MPILLRALLQALFAVLLASSAGAYAAAGAAIAESSLPNGMRILVKTDRRAPVAVVMVWYKAGSIDEVNGTTGVAHVLEHMMFKGTKAVPAGEYSRIIAEAGGRDNAFTSRDYTGYFQTLHKSQLELALKLEADRMANLTLSAEEFKKEIRVVMEERRWRTDDRPRALVFEQLMAAALKAHPYRHPIIGWMSDLENMRVEDAQDWYDKWYAPNNATLVVVGDVSAAEVQKLAQRYFGPLKQKPLPPRRITEEPRQLGIRQFTVKAPAELPYVMMAYHAPVLRDIGKEWEPFALEMLANVLDGNEAARLNRNLVRSARVASSAEASYDGVGRGPGMFYLSATPAQGKTVQDAERALRDEVARLIKDGVAEEELQRVKSQAVASHVYERDSMFYQARQIGSNVMADLPPNAADLFVDKLKEVTAEQVREVARKYLVDERLTVAYLDPQPLDSKKPSAPPPGLRHGQ
ncbi:MAG TPA: pitrilysin family protein [Burkholderiales bacterium]|nr:pitrilysin family protein [Burkholderiales bacterium]